MKRRVYISALLVLAVTAAWWLWQARRTPRLAARPPAVRPFVRIAGAGEGEEDKVLRERAKFFDPTPLFIPTPYNYGSSGLPDRVRREPGAIFRDYEPKLRHSEGLPALSTGAATAAESLVEIMARANEVPFAGIGEREVTRESLPERAAFLEIKSLQPGRFSNAVPITGVSPPKVGFGPMEFILTVGTAGLVGEPVLLSGSGATEVDVFFREYLVSRYAPGARLGPGRYRVTIGP